MKKSVMKKWVKALRSAEYTKGKNRLRRDDCYCVLGVLTDVVNPRGWRKYSGFEGVFAQGGEAGFLSKKVKEAAEMQSYRGYLSGNSGIWYQGSEYVTLIELNDQTDATFEEMADEIEKLYEKL